MNREVLHFSYTQWLYWRFPSCFVILGKEYVCIVRLHEAIDKVADLSKVSTHSMHWNLYMYVKVW